MSRWVAFTVLVVEGALGVTEFEPGGGLVRTGWWLIMTGNALKGMVEVILEVTKTHSLIPPVVDLKAFFGSSEAVVVVGACAVGVPGVEAGACFVLPSSSGF